MQQIADWLEKLGMSEYAQRFAENDIDVSVLRRSDRSGPQGHRGLARASAKDVARRLRSLSGAIASTAQSRRLPSRSPKTPPSAAKSR